MQASSSSREAYDRVPSILIVWILELMYRLPGMDQNGFSIMTKWPMEFKRYYAREISEISSQLKSTGSTSLLFMKISHPKPMREEEVK